MRLSTKDEIQYKFTVDSLPDHMGNGRKKKNGYGDKVFAALEAGGPYFYESQFKNISDAIQKEASAIKVAKDPSKRMIECPEVGTGFYWRGMIDAGVIVPRYIQTDDRLCSDHWPEVYAKYDIKALAETFGRDTITDARSHNTINEFDLRFGEGA
jgi:hypothetical protein